MVLSPDDIKTLSRALDDARRTFDCSAPRVSADGKDHVVSPNGSAVMHGTHGAAFLGIDPVSGAISCRVCAGAVTYVAPTKVVVQGKVRHHLVTP